MQWPMSILYLLIQYSLFQPYDNHLINQMNNSNESLIIEFISSSFQSLSHDMNSTIDILLTKGKYKSLEHFLLLAKKDNVEFKDLLANKIKEKKAQLDRVYQELIKIHNPNFLLVAPAFFWYQDNYHVTLEIMFSHRHTAPGCVDIEDYNAMIYENNQTFHFNANCLMGDDEYFFELEFNLFGKVNKIEEQQIARGMIKIRIEKTEKNEWNALVPEGENPPSNMIKKY